MGIDLAGFRFLRYALNGQQLGDVLTLGRQEVHISPPILRRESGLINSRLDDPFCEWILKSAFSAKSVASMDNSTYENATLIHDNNKPISYDLENRFDSVLDYGTLEHVFNIPQAIMNCIKMCKKDGMILHYIPANNQCGHGFWQISPELFFSLYSEENGFRDTEVFLVAPNDPSKFYRVKKPSNGRRAMVQSHDALIVAAKTRKARAHIEELSVQQSDYVSAWSNKDHKHHIPTATSGRIKRWLSNYPAIYEALQRIKLKIDARHVSDGLNSKNPWLERVDITSDNSGSRA